MSGTTEDKIIARFRVKVTKTQPDDRSSLCGEPAQTGPDGKQFFIIPAHQADYIKQIFPQYEVSEPGLPEELTQKTAPKEKEAGKP